MSNYPPEPRRDDGRYPMRKPPYTPMTAEEMSDAIRHIKNVCTWIVVLLVVNVAMTAYIWDFVHQIVQAVHSL